MFSYHYYSPNNKTIFLCTKQAETAIATATAVVVINQTQNIATKKPFFKLSTGLLYYL